MTGKEALPYKIGEYEMPISEKRREYERNEVEKFHISVPKFLATALREKLAQEGRTPHSFFIDAAANAITNIPASLFHEVRQNRNFTLKITGRKELITSAYYESYRESKDSIYLITNKLGYIEISFYPANIATIAAIYVNDRVEINFE